MFHTKIIKLANFLIKNSVKLGMLVVFIVLMMPVSLVSAQVYPDYCCSQPQVRKECAVIFSDKLPADCKQYSAICLQNEFGNCSPITLSGQSDTFDSGLEDEINVNFFGIGIRLDSDRAIIQVVSFGFFAVLGGAIIVTIFTIVRASIERALPEFNNSLPPEIQQVVNAILGLVLIVMSLVIAQIVATLIGVGSILEIGSANSILPT